MGVLAAIKRILQYTIMLIAKQLFTFYFSIIIDQFLIIIRSWFWSMIHILNHQYNVSIPLPVYGNLGLDTLILIIPAILAKIQGFCFFAFRRKRASGHHINQQFLKKAQGCQLGTLKENIVTLQILILNGLMISNQSKPIEGPLLQGYTKKSCFGCRTILGRPV